MQLSEDQKNCFKIQLTDCLIHEVTGQFLNRQSIGIYINDLKQKLIDIGAFTNIEALELIQEVLVRSIDYWIKEGTCQYVGMGRGSRYLEILLETIYAPMNSKRA